MESLLQDLGGVLRLAAVTLQALLRFETASCLALACFFAYRCLGDMVHSFVSCESCAVDVCTSTRDICPRVSGSVQCPSVTHSPHFLLSFIHYMRYTCTQTAFPFPHRLLHTASV